MHVPLALRTAVWSLGCVIADLFCEASLFGPEEGQQSCDLAQLMQIFKTLGKPSEATWPGVSKVRVRVPVRRSSHHCHFCNTCVHACELHIHLAAMGMPMGVVTLSLWLRVC